MGGRDAASIKKFYEFYHDVIADKRYDSPYWIRRYTHREIHRQILCQLQPGQKVLEAGFPW